MTLMESKGCAQLRRLSITQERMLEDAEKEIPRDEARIAGLKRALERTLQQIERDCS